MARGELVDAQGTVGRGVFSRAPLPLAMGRGDVCCYAAPMLETLSQLRSGHGMPTGRLASRAVIARHVLRKARRRRPFREAVRTAAAEALFFEIANQTFGPGSMIREPAGFYPHIFLPDYHGPHFEEALRRLVFPYRGPNILYFSLTGTCPCHCEYCFAGAGAAAPDIGDEAVLEVAEALARLRVPLVNISGGEPLTRYPRLLEAVRLLKVGCEPRLFTTGFGLTDARLAELRSAGLAGLFVSLDTCDRATFDRARGKAGAFDAAVSALRRAARADMLTFVNCVVDRHRMRTREQITAFLRFVESTDSRIVVNFLPQLATGRGADTDSFRDPEECEEVADRIVSTGRSLGRPISMLFGRVDSFMGCPGAGGKLMNVDIEGNVTVCISRAALGNVLDEPFEDIYSRFAQTCNRLKQGFFCCDMSALPVEGLLGEETTRRGLEEFYAARPDADWQRYIDGFGWLLARLYPMA